MLNSIASEEIYGIERSRKICVLYARREEKNHMKKKERRKSKKLGAILSMVCFMLVGAVCGVLMVKYIDSAVGPDISFGREILNLAAAFVIMYAAVFLQIVIHEAGHLIAGLCTGYTFSSFRIGSFMWVKENGKIKFRRLSLAGTGGQCLMNPPDMTDGKVPFVLYNLGGSLMNLATIPVCAVLFEFLRKIPFLPMFLIMMCVIGLAFALLNGIPMKLGTVNNDGNNAKDLGKSPDALKSFWIQMKVVEMTSKAVRLKDMPSEWFYLPDEDKMKNSMTAVMAVFYENRLMDGHVFTKAAVLIDKLLEMESGIVGVYRNLLICDRMYCELIGGKNREVIEQLYTKEQKKFMKQMKKFPSVIRTEYAHALLFENDIVKAEQIKVRFEKCAKTHPYATDIESERELMRITEEQVMIKNMNITLRKGK